MNQILEKIFKNSKNDISERKAQNAILEAQRIIKKCNIQQTKSSTTDIKLIVKGAA